MIRWSSALAAALACAGSVAGAQTASPDDPYTGRPVGIVDDPCPPPPPTNGDEWRARYLAALKRDFGQLCRYRDENRALKERPRVVFMGDSITEGWIKADPSLFTNGLVDRGISGQTTPQMLVRFRQDVLALRPAAVHIMAGTNDIAGNTGATSMETVEGHIQSMAELARANGIKVIIASIPPAGAFPWRPEVRPAPRIAAINAWAKDYARRNGFAWADYHSAMARPDGSMKPDLANDGVHPTPAGYAVMRPIALAAIRRTLGE